jgi:hypothetical protein
MQTVFDSIIRNIVPLGVLIVFGGTIIGIFRSKTPGFGKYTTSALILTLILFVAAMALVEIAGCGWPAGLAAAPSPRGAVLL